MVKLAIISDLHLEFRGWTWPSDTPEVDVIINAGDTHPDLGIREVFLETLPNKPYIEVYGNHDYYHQQSLGFCTQATCVDDKFFYGTTLWTKLTPEQYVMVESSLVDNDQIKGYSYDRTQHFHEMGLNAIQRGQPDVVVTHHGPSFKSMHSKYAGSPLNCAFFSDLDQFILDMEKPPVLWVHGHTHSSADYMIGNTRVICHPRGYPGEENHMDYKPLIVEI
jgi:predicted phosphodiesterase